MIKPCLLGGIFKLTDNRPPMVAFAAVKGKVEYEKLEDKRFIAKHGLTKFRMNPHFPVNTLMLMRGLVAARLRGEEAAYLEMGLQGLWEEGLKLDDKEVLARRNRGQCGRACSRRLETRSRQTEPCRNTDAVARGAFGVPTFFVGEEMFFGKERLAQVEEAAAARATQAAS